MNLGYSRFTIDYIGLCKLWHDITFQSYRFLGYSLRLGCLQPESNGIGESQLWPTQLFDSVSVLTIVDLDPIGLYYIYIGIYAYICNYSWLELIQISDPLPKLWWIQWIQWTRLKDDHFELDGGVLPQLEVSVPKLAPLDLTLGDPEEPLRSLWLWSQLKGLAPGIKCCSILLHWGQAKSLMKRCWSYTAMALWS